MYKVIEYFGTYPMLIVPWFTFSLFAFLIIGLSIRIIIDVIKKRKMNEYAKSLDDPWKELDPDKRDWEYDGEGYKRKKDTFEVVKENE